MFFTVLKCRIANWWETIRPLVPSILLLPIAPLLGWGPVTHLYLNRRALDKINPDDAEDEGVREILGDDKLRDIFMDTIYQKQQKTQWNVVFDGILVIFFLKRVIFTLGKRCDLN